MGIDLAQKSADDFLRIYISTKGYTYVTDAKEKEEKKVFINMQLRSSWLSHNIQVPLVS